MILTEEEVNRRLESPDNLINRIRSEVAGPTLVRQSELTNKPPSIDDLVEDADDKIRLTAAHKSSIEVMADSVNILKTRIHEIEKPEKLSRVAREMSAIVKDIDDMRNNRAGNNKTQITIWQPVIMQENHYETIHVHE